MQEITPQEEALIDCISAIIAGLKLQDYKHPQFTGFRNPENGGLVVLAQSPDEKTHFAIEVRTWRGA